MVAQGAGKDSGITVTGLNLPAGNNVVLKAEGGILLQAARNAFKLKTDNKSSSASIGIAYSTGGSQNGFTDERIRCQTTFSLRPSPENVV
ncbi:hemagglutinin repeat-containing protein [Achromobacter sp. PAB15]|uniref:hemagglutinin repeat-containing protein n=1 Tax=Achromobacter sp. PAB15 TaxID=3233048 RepID=UPI003F92E9B4